ncbi:ribosomal protein L7/L12 [Streptomyces sp. NPDC002133]|uniref:ribosomal protein L7/L12 n=1 Tax=Streptomyces sp. NPDC002133 TaxID=3154409 RepID=UPI00331E82A1
MSDSFLLICDDQPHSVVLTAPGPRAIEVVKLLHRRTGLSSWRCKALFGQLPVTVLENVPEEVADAVASELRGAGDRAEVRR